MIIPCNKNIIKLKNNQTLRIIITLQRLLQPTKHTLNEKLMPAKVLQTCSTQIMKSFSKCY